MTRVGVIPQSLPVEATPYPDRKSGRFGKLVPATGFSLHRVVVDG